MPYWEVLEIVTATYHFGDYHQATVWNMMSCQVGGFFNWTYEECDCSGEYRNECDCVQDANGIWNTEEDCNNNNPCCFNHGPGNAGGYELSGIYL